MRKSILALSVIFILAISTFTVSASPYRVTDTDMTIDIDDSSWYVMTRGNIKDNPELDVLGLTYDYMHSFFYDNEVYLNAIVFYDDNSYLELIIYKIPSDGFENLQEALDLFGEKELLASINETWKPLFGTDSDFYLYEANFPFVETEYYDDAVAVYVKDYYTYVNGDVYTLKFQGEHPFEEKDYEEIESIVNSTSFHVFPSENTVTTDSENSSSAVISAIGEKAIEGAIGGAILGGIAAVIGVLCKKKSSKAEKYDKDLENAENEINYRAIIKDFDDK